MRDPTWRRGLVIGVLLVAGLGTAATAGCPPIDVRRCEMMHQEWQECEQAKEAVGETTGDWSIADVGGGTR